MLKFLLITYAIWNLTVFFTYGLDKLRAKKELMRISEKTLLLEAFFMGGAGAFFGMRVFRHKTKHRKFNILVPLFMVLNMIIILLYFLKNA